MLTLQLRLLLVAIRTFSSLQAPARLAAWTGADPALALHAVRYLPVVGGLVAAITAAVYAVMSLWLPHELALLPALAAGLKMGHAIPERGVAGLTDRMMLGGQGGTSDIAVGAAGALALGMLMLTRFTAISTIDASWVGLTLVCAAAYSRGVAMVPAGAFHGASGVDRAVAFLLGVVPVIAGAWWSGEEDAMIGASILATVAALAVRRMARGHALLDDPRCFDGAQQAAELAFILGMIATLAIGDEVAADSAS